MVCFLLPGQRKCWPEAIDVLRQSLKTEYGMIFVEKYREKLGIKTGVHVHPLRRGKRDNFSAPAQVLELLEEYIEIRESDILPDRMRKVIPTKYTDTFVQQYMKDPDSVDKDKKEQFEMLLKQVGIDLEYQFFVKEYQGQDDLFGVVIDRDYNTHTVMQLNEIRKQCIEKGYHFFNYDTLL